MKHECNSKPKSINIEYNKEWDTWVLSGKNHKVFLGKIYFCSWCGERLTLGPVKGGDKEWKSSGNY